jgi:hypothetical protein
MFGHVCAENAFNVKVGQPLTGGHKALSGRKARKFGMKSIQEQPVTVSQG